MTHDHLPEIVAAAERIITDHKHRGGQVSTEVDMPLWHDLRATGFDLLGVPEHVGGSGGTLADLAAVLDVAAFHGARVPLAEAGLLAGWLLAEVGIAVPDTALTAAVDEASLSYEDGTWTITGRLTGVAWARGCASVAVLARHGRQRMVALVPLRSAASPAKDAPTAVSPGVTISPEQNLAAEPRDTVLLTEVELASGAVAAAPCHLEPDALALRGALVRSVQLAGAARAVRESTRRHILEREQFGRPIAGFQAVQQHFAALASEVSAMQVSAQSAVLAFAHDPGTAEEAVAMAKATTSGSAYAVAALGHQLHGALGYSQEHRLGAATTRLWAWRDEFGNEDFWSDRIGATLTARPPGALWPLLTGDAVDPETTP